MSVSTWRTADKVAVSFVQKWLKESKRSISIKFLADKVGCSYARMYNVLKYQNSPLIISEFLIICKVFTRNTAIEIDQIISKTAELDGTVEETNHWRHDAQTHDTKKQKREATFKQQKQAATNMLRDGVISIVNTYLETINSHKN